MPISESGVAGVQTQQNYLGVLGIIGELAVISQLLGSVTKLSWLYAAGTIPNDRRKLESGQPAHFILLEVSFTWLWSSLFSCFSCFYILVIYFSHKTRLSNNSPILRVIQTENECDGLMNTLIFIYCCSCSVVMLMILEFSK